MNTRGTQCMEDLKKIGKIVGTHGLKGEVKVFVITTQREERFGKGKEFYIKDNSGKFIKAKIKSYKEIPGKPSLLTMEGYEDINRVEEYVKCELYAEKIVNDEIIYLSDLLGMKVIGEDKTEYGTVQKAYYLSTTPYIIVNEQYVPFTMHIFIKEILDDEKTLVLTDRGEELFK